MIRQPLFHILALLLDYPGSNLRAALSEIHASVDADEFLPLERKVLLQHIEWMEKQESLALEAKYVETFDWTPSCDLHLSAHLLPEDDRGRGTVLLRLLEHYSAHGWVPSPQYLPDYLPVILDFAATLTIEESRVFLSAAQESITILEEKLRGIHSPYARLVAIILPYAQLVDNLPAGVES
ncbi:MAG: nitrate reductase molybdenum cofactor assembly chaperone [Acidithiobacillus sp.]|nr:nitrate reductase molybdenum cofactor assembly chaperone [Acidithiobacillus sp.]